MIISPSVLSLDYSRFAEQLSVLNSEVEWLHFDVMDGHFVPNISFGPDILKTFRRNSELYLDTHLMISDPLKYLDVFTKAGADGITFHVEALKDLSECQSVIGEIKKRHLKAGISIKPNTPVSAIEPLLSNLDLVLVMSVEPGFGGQKFMPDSLEKVKELVSLRESNGYSYLIEIDGGVNDLNAHEISEAGVDVVVAGSFVFKGDMKANIDKLKAVK